MVAGAVALALLTSTALAACSEPAPEDEATGTTTDDREICAPEDLLECARASTIGDLVPDEATEATGEPLLLGMVNQENTPAGSYPELSQAVQAAVDFVNAELGGVDGRPIEIEVCNTEFSAEGSTSCAQQFVEDEVPAVLGGIDVFGNAVDTLSENGVGFIGGIPISTQSVQSPDSFQWSGGSWGATVAFANHAIEELEAERVSIVYGEFGSITHSAEVGAEVLEAGGVEAQLVPYPIMATDISAALNAAAATDPDALIILAADSGCKASFDGIAAMDLDAQAYVVGACAAPSIIDQVGADVVEGTIFNVEGPIDRDDPDPDAKLYASIVDAYGDGLDPVGAGTVSFRSFMNLYSVLVGLDGDITPEAITESLRSKVDEPSFMGHDYTCDGEQFAGLPSMCSPQQILVEMEAGELVQIGDWVDVGAIYAG